ncbi:hypothetical protein [Halococcoides cellulosivorans]|uniref:TRAM domain-containing protein n=1 Tax=Halococcoides cellulosivorans TaxID=1679096 RepID=A0A2R4X1F6_9EURY|nr:hypothetical protein [Halococcoides cellulosivorans]AWB27616.1 hypothetical protein HARCEL1_07790 [Halococcoides cellulosivorans]
MRISTAVSWLVVCAGVAALGAVVWTDRVARAVVPRAVGAGLLALLVGVTLGRLASTRTRQASTGLGAPRVWPVIVIGGVLGSAVLATIGALGGGLVALPIVEAPLTVEALRTTPLVRRAALAGVVLTHALAGAAGLTTLAHTITPGDRVAATGPAISLAAIAAAGLALAPIGTVPMAGLTVALGALGVGLYARAPIRALLDRLGLDARVLPARSEWAHDAADAERAHRRAQKRAPPLDIGETTSIVVQERLDGGRQLRGVYEDFQVFVKWDVPPDCATGETICVRIEDYGTNDAGQRTSGQARFLSRGAC